MTTASTNLRVLVVDDELLIRWSVAETLSAAGHSVVQAGDARSAMEALHSMGRNVDVVLLDFRLPDSNDLGLLGNIRREVPGAAVVMMTAYGTHDVVSGALALGARSVMTKPFDMHGLDAVVRDAHASRPN
jgi:DNA-binding NtrC family response regulator